MINNIPEKKLEKMVKWCDNRAESIPYLDWFLVKTRNSDVELISGRNISKYDSGKIIYRRFRNDGKNSFEK